MRWVVVFTMDWTHAIAGVVGPFETEDDARAYLDKHRGAGADGDVKPLVAPLK